MRRMFAALFGAALLCGAPVRAATLEAYGGYPTIDNVMISPAGDKIAFAEGEAGKRGVFVHMLDDGKLIGGLNLGDAKLRAIMWADDEHIVVTTSQAGRAIDVEGPKAEWELANVYNVTTHQQRGLLDNATDEMKMNVIEGAPQARSVDGKTKVFVTGIYFPTGTRGIPALFSIDADSGHTDLLENNSPNSEGWIIDDKGTVVAESDFNDRAQHWSLKLRDGRGWKEAYGLDTAIDVPDVEGLTPDGQGVVVGMVDKDDYDMKAFALSDGHETEFAPPAKGAGEFVMDPETHRIIGAKITGMNFRYMFYSPEDQARWRKVANAYLGEQVELISWSDDKNKIIVRVNGMRDGATYQLVDLTTLRGETIGPLYNGVNPEDVAEVKPIAYKAADGLEIPAYLTLPKGRDPKNLPLIVLPHGGPAARDAPGFDWLSQAIASRGYAVLQPEFRGSDGFGLDFLQAGFGQWGRKMQTDLSDGVRYLAAQGTIDPKRVCILGASYGGYAALAGAALDPGVYRCAVSVAGIGDLRDFVEWRKNRAYHDDEQSRYWERFMGTSDLDDPKFDEISPIKHIDKVTIPILLIHGKDDTVVPIGQSEDMADALERAKKDVTFVKLDGEDHWLSRAETRTQMIEAAVAFLEKNNPP